MQSFGNSGGRPRKLAGHQLQKIYRLVECINPLVDCRTWPLRIMANNCNLIAEAFSRKQSTLISFRINKGPRQLNFVFALWTRGMIRELIRRQFIVRFSEVSVGRLLKKLAFCPQRPQRRTFQHDELLVVEWMAKDFPAIQ